MLKGKADHMSCIPLKDLNVSVEIVNKVDIHVGVRHSNQQSLNPKGKLCEKSYLVRVHKCFFMVKLIVN